MYCINIQMPIFHLVGKCMRAKTLKSALLHCSNSTLSTVLFLCLFLQFILALYFAVYFYLASPPPAPNMTSIIQISTNSSSLLISWSMSDCAVQYVVTIINSSDGSVYLNITTSDTNTTVTLPTGVEYCITVLGVDSIARRGPPSQQQCHRNSEKKLMVIVCKCSILPSSVPSMSSSITIISSSIGSTALTCMFGL